MTVYTYNFLSGGVKGSGSAERNRSRVFLPSGGTKLSGSASSSYRASIRQYVGSGGLRASGSSFVHKVGQVTSMTSIPNTTCTIGAFSLAYEQAHSLSWAISSSDTSRHAQLTITGSGLEPPPFDEDSFTGPVAITLQKQSFPSYSGTVVVKQVSINLAANEAEWQWTLEVEEVTGTTCTLGAFSIGYDEARTLTWSISRQEDSDYDKISISGSGVEPPPFNESSFTAPIAITLQKTGFPSYTGTVSVTQVSITTNADTASWSWTLEAEEKPTPGTENFTCILGAYTITLDHVKELDWSTANSDTSSHTTVTVNGSGGKNPPPFTEDDLVGDISVTLIKDSSSYTGTIRINQVSITTNAINGTWSWSVSGTEVTATTCTLDTYSIDFPEADDLSWTVSSADTSGHATVSITGAGLEPPPFDETSFTGPISITLQKPSFPAYSGTVVVRQVSVSTNATEKSWSWSVEAVEVTATTCTIGAFSIGYEEAHTLSWAISSSESSGLATLSIQGGGLEPPPFNESSFSGPISVTLQKAGFPSYSGSVIVSAVSINTAADSASFSWTLTATEAPTKVCTIGAYTITQSAAHELNWSVAANFPSVRPTISISGTGLAHPPFYEDSFPTAVAVTLSSQGTVSYSGTVLIKTVNIQTDTKNATWSWSLDGEEVPTSTCTIAGSTLSYEQAYDLSWDISNIEAKYLMRAGDGTAIVRTTWTGKHAVSISGTGRVPPPFGSNSFPGLFDIALTKGSSSYSGSVIATSVSVTTNATEDSWSWSLECEEV